ncbi:MAG: helix-turn-helix domain-containing protein [Mediterranea sp.]|jgi:AraC-like DNA-binding protein|nr:helix-turn-helix domain-containing protein [Mediterranea sp.]
MKYDRLLILPMTAMVCLIVFCACSHNKTELLMHDNAQQVDVSKWIAEAQAAEREKKYEKAMRLWFDAFNEYQLHLEDYPASINCAHRIVQLSSYAADSFLPNTLHYYAAIAELCYDLSDYTNADILLQYIFEHPSAAYDNGALSQAYCISGLILAAQNQLERATDMFTLGMHNKLLVYADTTLINPYYYRCKLGIGYVHSLQKDYVQALPWFRGAFHEAIGNHDYDCAGETACMLALTYGQLDMRDSMYHYVNTAVQHYKKASHVRLHQGLLYLAQGEYEHLYGNREQSVILLKQAFETHSKRKERLSISNLNGPVNFILPPEEEEQEQFVKTHRLMIATAICCVLLLIILAWILIKYRLRFQPPPKQQPDDKEVQLYNEIVDFMQNTKMYRSADFSIIELSKHLNKDARMISVAVNRVSEKNFHRFVNQWRIADAVNMINSDSPLSIEALGEEVGFANRTTFWRSFKMIMGMSIEEYVKEQKRKNNRTKQT